MRISVVIPAYNEEKSIRQTLGHILDQTYPAHEVIVVDNNSTDATAAIAKEMGARVVKEKAQGITLARNAGFNAARGDIIARTDADTRVPRDWLEKIHTAFLTHSNVVGLSGPILYYDLKMGQLTAFVRVYRQTCKLLYGNEIMIGPNMAIRKSSWEKIKDEVCVDDTNMHEDLDLSIHLSKVGRIIFDKKFTVRTSGRRIKNNPASFFFGYTQKHIPMIKKHKKFPISLRLLSEAEHRT
jgi:glycosyltransferase involved in cell wall biosynthesis